MPSVWVYRTPQHMLHDHRMGVPFCGPKDKKPLFQERGKHLGCEGDQQSGMLSKLSEQDELGSVLK